MIEKRYARRLCILHLLYEMAPEPVPRSLIESTLEGPRSAFRGVSRETWFSDLRALREMGAAIQVDRSGGDVRYYLLNPEQVRAGVEAWSRCADELRELDRFRGLLGGVDHDQPSML